MIADSYQSRITAIDNLLKRRAAVYPNRDNIYVQLNKVIEEFANYLIDTTDFKGFQPDKNVLIETESFSDNPVFICGSMKSGTSLVTQLLDSHPALLVMSGDSRYVNNMDRWKRTQFSDIFTYWLQRIINPTGKEPFWFLGRKKFIFETFLQYLYYFLTKSQKDIFICVILAIYAANRNHLRSSGHVKYWVEKTTHNEFKVSMLHKKFPNSIFIHIIRNPLTNIASLKKLSLIRNWSGTSSDYAFSIKKSFRFALYNQRLIGKNRYHIVKYEDLISKPKEILTSICKILNIPFDEILLVPTENNRPGIANSMYPEYRIKGKIFDKSKSERYKEDLSEGEIKNIITVLYPEAIKFGYDWDQGSIAYYHRKFLQNKLQYYFLRINKMWRSIMKKFN